MAVFPALRPGTRTFTAATYPGVAHIAYSGRQSRVRTSNASTGARLRLQFPGITEAQMLEIASHYAGQRGRFLPFTLPDAVLSGMTNPAVLTPAGYLWIYAGSPKVVDISTGTAAAPSCVHDVELELELVPEVSRLASGARWSAVAAIAGGVANGGNVSLAGAQWSAAASITSADNIYDGSASGAAWSATASIVGGSVNYAVTTAGAAWSASAAIAGGTGSASDATYLWQIANTDNPPANAYRLYGATSGSFLGRARLSTTTSTGYKRDQIIAAFTLNKPVSINVNGVTRTGAVSVAAILQDSGTPTERVLLNFNVSPLFTDTAVGDTSLAITIL